jgi:hypothetical protein
MPVSLPTSRQVFNGAVTGIRINKGRMTGRFQFKMGDRRVRTPFYITSGVLARLGTVARGYQALYGEFRNGTFIVLGPDLRRAPAEAAPVEGPRAPRPVSGEVYRLQQRYNRAGALYLLAIFRFVDEAGRAQTKDLLVRGSTAIALKGLIQEGPMTVEGYVAGDAFEVTGVARAERGESATGTATGTRAEPAYRQTLEGFWRTLKAHQIGKGLNGEPVEGKTWVTGFTRYKNKPLRPVMVVNG